MDHAQYKNGTCDEEEHLIENYAAESGLDTVVVCLAVLLHIELFDE